MSGWGLLGRTLGHSFSPAIHRALWGCGDYQLLPMEEKEARAFLAARPFEGINVTIPYKRLALEMCDVVDARAARIGAVNTVVNRSGVLYGYNTDYDGMRACLARAGIGLAGQKVLVFGSGGTSRTACTLAADAGARCTVVVSRSGPDNYENLGRHADAGVLLNTTPLGMFPSPEGLPADPARFAALRGVMDAVYNPLATRFVQLARAAGVPACGGLAMLVEQGRAAAELFSGRPVAPGAADRCLAELARAESNLVLIGMPGCGKTTVGRLLAERLGRPFVDLDAEIVREAGRTIPELFAAEGEEGFRARESAAVRRFAAQHGLVLACGGGTPLREENRIALHGNGRLYYLSCEPGRLSGEGRPLSGSPEAIRRLYEQRRGLYGRTADRIIEADTSPEAEARAIEEDFNA